MPMLMLMHTLTSKHGGGQHGWHGWHGETQSVSRLGSSSALSRSRSCIVTAVAVDMVPPSGTVRLQARHPGSACGSGAVRAFETARHRWRQATDLMYAVKRTFCTVTTVQ